MDNPHRRPDPIVPADLTPEPSGAHPASEPLAPTDAPAAPLDDVGEVDDGIIEEVTDLFDDGVTYAQAEIAFQKTRAKLAGKGIGVAAGLVAVALILLHIALLALAVGLVIALQPLVTIWGAIAIVVGVILLLAGWLAMKAKSKASQVSALFSSENKT